MTNSTSPFVSITDAPPYGELLEGGENPTVGRNHCVLPTQAVDFPTHVQTTFGPSFVVVPYPVFHVGCEDPLVPLVVHTWKLLFVSTMALKTAPLVVHAV